MTASDTNTQATEKARPVTPEEIERRDRVRLVRRLSKWLTEFDSISSDAAKLWRDGVRSPDGWGFDFGEFFQQTNGIRAYLMSVLRNATDPTTGKRKASGER